MNKPISLLFLIVTFFVLSYFYQYDPNSSENFFLFCPTKLFFEFDCPLCGGQRYLHYFLNLEIKNAFEANAFLFLTFPIVFYMLIVFLLKPFYILLPNIQINNKIVLFIIFIALLFTVIRNLDF